MCSLFIWKALNHSFAAFCKPSFQYAESWIIFCTLRMQWMQGWRRSCPRWASGMKRGQVVTLMMFRLGPHGNFVGRVRCKYRYIRTWGVLFDVFLLGKGGSLERCHLIFDGFPLFKSTDDFITWIEPLWEKSFAHLQSPFWCFGIRILGVVNVGTLTFTSPWGISVLESYRGAQIFQCLRAVLELEDADQGTFDWMMDS